MLPLPFPASTISLGFGAVDGEYYFPWAPHMGDDFSSRSQGVTAGAVIYASGVGRVVRQGVGPAGVTPSIDRPNSLAGNSIDVDYGACIARYMHRPYNSPSPATGADVREGTILGTVGDTGLSGGAHLHLETWDKTTGRRVDPQTFFDFSRVVGDGSTASDTARPFNPVTPALIGADMASLRIIDSPAYRAASQRVIHNGSAAMSVPSGWVQPLVEAGVDFHAYEHDQNLTDEVNLVWQLGGLDADTAARKTAALLKP